MKTLLIFTFIGFHSSLSLATQSEPKVAASCVGCHGEKGKSLNDLWPNLAGQKKGYLIKQLTSFKNGSRQDPLMAPLSSNLSESDIQVLADYYSSLK
ncbi:MAG: c-type cytochrome [Bdellovibrionaceae bacterium]|nr:c-type cytochrome [Pseudobdellovibrionaceae bacterium]